MFLNTRTSRRDIKETTFSRYMEIGMPENLKQIYVK
jgi:hypothetical protein